MEADKSIESYLRKKNPEARLLIRIFAIFGFVVILILLAGFIFIKVRVPQLLEFSKGIKEFRIPIEMDSLENARFIQGLNGCENLCFDLVSEGYYVSSLDGNITFLGSGQQRSYKAGAGVSGLSVGKDGSLLAAVCMGSLQDWKSRGAAIYRISGGFNAMERLSEDYPSMNGICHDSAGNLYFTTSNFKFMDPQGAVYRMNYKGNGNYALPELFIPEVGLANGLYYDKNQDRIYFSNTIGGVYSFTPDSPVLKEEYLKTGFMENCDDLCTDSGGNIWITDPGQGTVKMFNPGTGSLTRFIIEGMGQASSCRIRVEGGLDVLYITELKAPSKNKPESFNGRGVLIVPAQSLIKLLEPYLID